jgi:plastocyanin
VVLAVGAALGFAACGSSNKDSSTSTAAPAATPTTADSGASGGGGSTVTVAADPSGQLAYDKKTLTAKAGSVTIDFTNDSSTPHNVTIEQGEKELGNTDTIQASKATKTITLKAGTYSFYCSVGSHEAAGMKGTLTVQ